MPSALEKLELKASLKAQMALLLFSQPFRELGTPLRCGESRNPSLPCAGAARAGIPPAAFERTRFPAGSWITGLGCRAHSAGKGGSQSRGSSWRGSWRCSYLAAFVCERRRRSDTFCLRCHVPLPVALPGAAEPATPCK